MKPTNNETQKYAKLGKYLVDLQDIKTEGQRGNDYKGNDYKSY